MEQQKPERIAELIFLLLKGNATTSEQDELNHWLLEDEANRHWFEMVLEKEYISTTIKNVAAAQATTTASLKRLGYIINNDEQALHIVAVRKKVIHRRLITRYVAAAVLFIALIFSIFFYKQPHHERPVHAMVAPTSGDILAPVTSRAMITLADGSKVFLDSIKNGQLAQQGNIKLIKLANGQIAYQMANGPDLAEPKYNTLTNPRGSKIVDMQLSDGSHIWLNAGSSITYPVTFGKNMRNVVLTGEGYFEVAKDKTRKFIVISNGVTTEVLGTHFNVNAYNNDKTIKVTLLEGSVRTGNNNGALVIKPGQQSIVGNGNLSLNNTPNIEQVMAWKNGYFSFDGLTLKQAMAQLERWYDIDVVYEGNVEDIELVGKMTRGITLNGLMIVLKQLGVNYQLEGRKLIIK